jgi:tetratricopeptide (TPR) repeat protein/transcriptional regulator with XRE-family HTH domain
MSIRHKPEFAPQLRAYINADKYGRSQNQIAKAIDRDPSLITRWLSGERQIPYQNLYEICLVLELSKAQQDELVELAGYDPDELVLGPTEPMISPGLRHSALPPIQRPSRSEYFMGREAELAQLLEYLKPGKVVILDSLEGVGKTTLATEALWQLAPPELFPHGILYYDCYSHPQIKLILEQIVLTLGELPRPTPDLAAEQTMAEQQALIVLDGAEMANDLGELLDTHGSCGLLIIGRTPLPLSTAAEYERHQITLKPFSVEQAAALLRIWGKRRAKDKGVCRDLAQLAGPHPLAMRLIGAYLYTSKENAPFYLSWLKETPLAGLDESSRPLHSIPLILEHSLKQVSETARQALGVAGVLALSPFDRKLIAKALGVSVPEIGQALKELMNYGFLWREKTGWYQITHSLVMAYAQQQLPPTKEVLQQLTGGYISLAKKQGVSGQAGFRRLESEWPHLRAILNLCAKERDWKAVQRLTWAVDDYLNLYNRWHERIETLKMGLVAAQETNNRQNEGAFLGALGTTYYTLGQARQANQYEQQSRAIARRGGRRLSHKQEQPPVTSADGIQQAIEYYHQALEIARKLGNRHNEEDYLSKLGLVYKYHNKVEQAIEYHQQALTISRQVGSQRTEAIHLSNLGNAAMALGDSERAAEYHQQALLLSRIIGDRPAEGTYLNNLGALCIAQGNFEPAIQYYEQALAISREIGNPQTEGADLGSLGVAYYFQGNSEKAKEYLDQMQTLLQNNYSPHTTLVRKLMSSFEQI